MVSNASDDLPDPETPVTTVRELWGISRSMFFRLWTRAPRTTMLSFDICPKFVGRFRQGSGRPCPAQTSQIAPKTSAETSYYSFDFPCRSPEQATPQEF